jgi:adenylate cyclase
MASIRFLNGPRENQQIHIKGGEICGRDEVTEIQILVPGISRRHCQFIEEAGVYFLCDMGSMNHTYVNQQTINKHKLVHGDTISVGGIHFEFSFDNVLVTQSAELEPEDLHNIVEATNFFQSGIFESAGSSSKNQIETLKRRLQTFYGVVEELGTVQNTNELLNQIMQKLFEAFPQCDRGLIMVGESIDTLTPKVARFRDPDEKSSMPISSTISHKVFTQKQAILSKDLMDDSESKLSETVIQFHHRSMMCAPLLFREDCLGYILLDSKGKGRFKKDDLSLLTGIGALAAIFLRNDKLRRLKEIQKYVPPEIADQIANGQIDMKPGGDEKTGTVFFSDLIGFTSLSEKLAPHEIITLMNRYFERMVTVIFKHHGYIDKYIGDAIMAVWGVPSPVENEVHHAVTAAIEMQLALYLFNQELVAEGTEELFMAIGLNSGDFIAGNLGSERRMEYTVLGDAVNLAQRVESKSGRGTVFISESTYERGGRNILACRLKPAMVKGKRDEVTIYSVRGVPGEEDGLFVMCLPFFVTEDGKEHEGLLTKAKYVAGGRVLCQILIPFKPTKKSLALTFVAPEIPSFGVNFVIQRELPLTEPYVTCLNGSAAINDTPLEELLVDGDYMSPRSPNDMPRNKPYEVWHYTPE